MSLNIGQDPRDLAKESAQPQRLSGQSLQDATLNAPVMATQQWRVLIMRRKVKPMPRGADAAWLGAMAWLKMWWPHMPAIRRLTRRILALESRMKALSDQQLAERMLKRRDTFRVGRETDEQVVEAFAMVREQARRMLQMQAYPNQIMAAVALYRQTIAEVATGEGKTLIAALAATVLGWRGLGCHVVTVNDYLAKRDAEQLQPFFASCGLTVASIEQDSDPNERRQAYGADITYVTNKEVCADYLRDQLVLQGQKRLSHMLLSYYRQGGSASGMSSNGGPLERVVMRGLACAIVDEVDSILLDEAATPLIISTDAPNDESVEAYQRAVTLARQLQAQRDFSVNQKYREVRLTSAGRETLARLCESDEGVYASPRRREELVAQALTAQQLFHRDQHYIVNDEGKIVIIDESTGRQMPDRTWRDGLHQSVEAKEQVEVNPPKSTMARVSFQRFFRQYRHLCGLSGTTWEGRQEFQHIYERPTVRIPTNRPLIRKHRGERIFTHSKQRWEAVVDEILTQRQAGLPVLVGTSSVEASELLSGLLHAKEIPHQVLNAVRHEAEAAIIAEAGRRGAVTIATNMAGRGTDIRLADGVEKQGGLQVIATNKHEAARLDRQLFGRAGRQGQPGATIMFIALDDPLIKRHLPKYQQALARVLLQGGNPVGRWVVQRLINAAQCRAQRMSYKHRKQVLRVDQWLEEHVGFAPDVQYVDRYQGWVWQ